jgi:alpha-ketoglutarate-dependent taurine dioxygenase
MAAVLEKIKITPLSAACGAEITGVDLTQELSAPTVAAIRQAWHDHIVLVFRGQEVTEEQQLRFASYFGSLGRRKEAMFREELQLRNQGTKQVNPNILLVSNIKEKGEPIGAFGEGETRLAPLPAGGDEVGELSIAFSLPPALAGSAAGAALFALPAEGLAAA